MLNIKNNNMHWISATATDSAAGLQAIIENVPYGGIRVFDLDVAMSQYLGLPQERYTLMVTRTNAGRGWVIAIPLNSNVIYKRHLFNAKWSVFSGNPLGGGNKCLSLSVKGGGVNDKNEQRFCGDDKCYNMSDKRGFLRAYAVAGGVYTSPLSRCRCLLRDNRTSGESEILAFSRKGEQLGRCDDSDTAKRLNDNVQVIYYRRKLERLDRNVSLLRKGVA